MKISEKMWQFQRFFSLCFHMVSLQHEIIVFFMENRRDENVSGIFLEILVQPRWYI